MERIAELDRRGHRHFGVVTGAILAALFGLFFPWLLGAGYPAWPWLIGGTLAVWGLVAPASLRGVYRVWMQFALMLNKITTPVIMGLVFYAVITPVALVMRLVGRDSMSRRFDPERHTYRVLSRKAKRQDMERPF